MEGWRDVVAGEAPAAAQGRCGGGGDESDDGSSSGVELSLQLGTGSSSTPAAAVTTEAAAAARRSMMTIFYNGRMCAVDVTEIQAREIISMANQEILADQQQQQLRRSDDRRQQDSGSGSGSATAQCGGQVRSLTASPPAASPRHGLATMAAAAPVINQTATTLSMKRSLQRFLQKRQARTADAGGQQQAQAMRHY